MPIETWAVISRDGEAGWCGRRKHQVVSHRGSLYLMGGYTSAGVIGAGTGPDANLNDVWKSTEGSVGHVSALLMGWVDFLVLAVRRRVAVEYFSSLGCLIKNMGIVVGISCLHFAVSSLFSSLPSNLLRGCCGWCGCCSRGW